MQDTTGAGPNERIVNGTWSGPLNPPESIPDTADVIIIGGGIVGVSTAWFLARQGVSVVLCEKGYISGEQSGRNWGWVRVQGRDPREVPMMLDAMATWRTLHDEIGEDVGYTEGGCLFAARTDKEMAELEGWHSVALEFDLPTRMLSVEELKAHVGDVAGQWKGALYTSTDGRAEPHLAGPAIARAAERAGARILTGCAVRGLLREGGRTAGVVTEAGEIRAPIVVCAAGAWTSYFCRAEGIDVPQLKVRGTVARTGPADLPLTGNLFDSKVGIRRRNDGGYTVAHGSILDHGITPSTFRYSLKFLPALSRELKVLRLRFGKDFIEEVARPARWALDETSPFEKQRVLNPKPGRGVLRKLRRNLNATFPQFTNVPIVESWAGMVETTPDVVPVIGEEPSVPGFYVATGFSGHGFGIGPGAGKAIAALVTGGDTKINFHEFRRGRFFDGSKIRPYTAI